LDDLELIEEGVGFGVPVVKYSDKTYFAGQSELWVHQAPFGQEIKKTYVLDTISRKKFSNGRYIDDGIYTFARKRFEKIYLNRKRLFPLLNRLMELRNLAGISTEFVKVKPRGIVEVVYRCQPSGVTVEVKFSDLEPGLCEKVLVLNEQGSHTFDKYADTNGLTLLKSRIGAWDAVDADKASLLNRSEQLSFSLQNMQNALLFRGWEQTKQRFSWAGLSYALKPNSGKFEYKIAVSLRQSDRRFKQGTA
jgi:hypothetical protein